MHVREQDRDLDVHREVDAGSADAVIWSSGYPCRVPVVIAVLGYLPSHTRPKNVLVLMVTPW